MEVQRSEGVWRDVARGGLNAYVPGCLGINTPHRSVMPFADVWARIGHRDTLPAVRVYAVVSEQMEDEALERFVDRQMAELMVENWDRDEPDRAGQLYVEPVELETSSN
jgi:hypothetical protein